MAFAAVMVIVACQPVGGDGLWWEMSRGRAVWEGHIRPSASLLSMESEAEADWLGGLPLYVVHQSLGFNGGMLVRMMLPILAAVILWKTRRSRRWLFAPHLVLFGLTAIALSADLGLQPVFYDLVGIAFLPPWLHDRSRRVIEPASTSDTASPLSRPQTLAAVLFAFAVWSNLAAGFVLGALLCLVALLDRWRRKAITLPWCMAVVTAIAIGGSMNPRGVFAWSDSLQTLLPFLGNPGYILSATPWGSMLQNTWGWNQLYFLVLTGIWIGELFIRPRTRCRHVNQYDLLGFAVVQWFAWASLQNVPLAILWLTINLAIRWRGPTAPIATMDPQPAVLKPNRWSVAGQSAISTFVLLVAIWSSGLLSSFGWGIDRRQDYRLLQNSLQRTRPYGTAFADDTRSAAMLAWILPELPSPAAGQTRLRVQDIPLRAVRQGRFEKHLQLLRDLSRNRLMRYWRTDGSAGGYWLPFAERNTTLICLSNTNTVGIRGLEDTPWQPLSLDSVVIPFAVAGDEAYVQQMIQILRNRETIEYRYWQYSPPPSSGSAFDRDRFGQVPEPISAAAVCEQTEVFRAMDLHYAALRVVTVGRRLFPDDPCLQDAFLQCQRELADQERIDAGAASWFRSLAATPTVPASLPADDASYDFQASFDPPLSATGDSSAAEALRSLVPIYRRDGASEMLAASSRMAAGNAPPQVLYGCLCAALESGNYDRADQLIAQLKKRDLASPLRELVLAREVEYRPEHFDRSRGAGSVRHKGNE
ncbi:hypothetical protein [Roseimaritima sediminicola]|uniref:hypothetical protein n=1 Tax=Roseimaritima sediminicola TaxID=2662066 RepID=UPI00129852B4|nr:hypothetical protein [Roseimaritima sediminicola]